MLGVPKDADDATIKKAYRKLARENHPDVNADPVAQEKFKDVSHAYEILSDPQKRAAYDRGGEGVFGGFGQGFTFTDIMDAFFGNGGGTAQNRGPRPRQRRGQDALIRLDITLAEAAFGATKQLEVDTAVGCTTCQGAGTAPGGRPSICETCRGAGEVAQVQRSFLGEIRTLRPCAACKGYGTVIVDPCRDCAGEGRVRTHKTLKVAIPPGVDNGTRVHLAEQGEVGVGAGPAGDLYVEIRVEKHDLFTRQGNELHCIVTLPMTAAALGTKLTLPTLESDLEATPEEDRTFVLDVRPGTQSGTDHIIRGRGVPGLRGGRGDLIATVLVETPTKLDEGQEELLQQLAAVRGEQRPVGQLRATKKGVFGRLRDVVAPH